LIIIRLGELIFNASEVPQRVNSGGSQMLVKQQLIGGVRVIDALGKNDDDIVFSGLITGIIDQERSKYLDYLRTSGIQVNFTYSSFNYSAVMRDYKPDLRMGYKNYYTITLTIIEDLNAPITIAIPTSFSDEILGAYQAALTLAELIANPSILSTMTELGITLEGINDINSATAYEISLMTQSISACISSTNEVINGTIA
jgi:hypothetical protein